MTAPSSPRRGDDRLVDGFIDPCDVVVYTRAWKTDSPAKKGERPDSMVHARVFINAKEVDRAVGAKMIASSDFLTVDVRVAPSSFNVVALDEEDWEKLNEVPGATV